MGNLHLDLASHDPPKDLRGVEVLLAGGDIGPGVSGLKFDVAGKVSEIDPRAPLIDAEGKLIAHSYDPGDDGVVEPLPPTAEELAKNSPESEFSGYVGLQRDN